MWSQALNILFIVWHFASLIYLLFTVSLPSKLPWYFLKVLDVKWLIQDHTARGHCIVLYLEMPDFLCFLQCQLNQPQLAEKSVGNHPFNNTPRISGFQGSKTRTWRDEALEANIVARNKPHSEQVQEWVQKFQQSSPESHHTSQLLLRRKAA